MKTLALFSPVDAKPVSFSPAKGNATQFMRGKCWSAFCSNPIWCVHLSKKGIASHGYCYCCVQWRVQNDFVIGLKRQGDWFMMEKGRLIKWEYDSKTHSFKPSKK